MASHAPKRPNLVSVTTINADGSHLKLHPADVKGRFTLARRLFALLILAVYIALPWIEINGFPAVFFDLEARRLHLFGLTFPAQDLWLAFFAISGLGFSLFFITSLFGRLWCGWACPYTIFLEHVFRRIERWVDGDATARRKLERAPWDGRKITRFAIKHALYLLAASIVAHIFMSYFVSLDGLYSYMRQSPAENFSVFAVVAFITVALYFAFSWFREQFCIILCPYGRIQSALTDDDTLVIGYDSERGEPRGKKNTSGAGDCIDCNRCVQVCPTGIDIRNGLQMECIGCAACVDACDTVMEKIDRPRGLVRYDSSNGLAGSRRRFIRPRIIVYSLLLGLGATAFGLALTRVHDVDMTVTRMRGMPFYVDDQNIQNQFQLRLLTKRNAETTFEIDLKDAPEWVTTSGAEGIIKLPPQGEDKLTFVVFTPREHYSGSFTLTIRTRSQPGGTVIEREVEFLGPDPRLLDDLSPPDKPKDENKPD